VQEKRALKFVDRRIDLKDNLKDSLRKSFPVFAIILILAATITQLYRQGRVFWCACGIYNIWSGDIQSAHNSQHIFDAYSFTHLLHGVAFFLIVLGISRLFSKSVPLNWGLTLAVLLESIWEVVENSRFVIERYRQATIALGYNGDSIANSISDILCCATGFVLASYLGPRRSIIVFLAVEIVLAIWIRDNLTLNVIMLIHPVDAIKQWQMTH
jgi:hypothetical protein